MATRQCRSAGFFLGPFLALVAIVPAPADDAPAPKVAPKPQLSRPPLSLDPKPLPLIPDDPPPHEGAMIDIPYTIQPPDLIDIEVIEGLPGRPIIGEHLVRPDGMVSLGFYGDVYVRGLTLAQAKAKIVLHLRPHLRDDVLGLIEYDNPDEPAPARPPGQADRVAPLPLPDPAPLPAVDPVPPGNVPAPDAPPVARPAAFVPQGRGDANGPARPAASRVRQATRHVPTPAAAPAGNPPAAPAAAPPVIEIPAAEGNPPVAVPAPLPEANVRGEFRVVRPEDSLCVFVETTAYNSQFYYVQGWVASPGRMPSTGNETVLDALNYAGGFINGADPKNVRLVRPGRNGKPAKVYVIDHDAILEKGDPKANLQLFPGDRLVIGRMNAGLAEVGRPRGARVVSDVKPANGFNAP